MNTSTTPSPKIKPLNGAGKTHDTGKKTAPKTPEKPRNPRAVRYSAEFKATAVRRARDGEPISTIAREMGTTDFSVYTWRKQADAAAPVVGRKDKDTPPGLAPATAVVIAAPTTVTPPCVQDAIGLLSNALREYDSTRPCDLSEGQSLVILALRTLERGFNKRRRISS